MTQPGTRDDRNDEQKMEENHLAKLALVVSFVIHRKYEPGLFESVYEKVFSYEW